MSMGGHGMGGGGQFGGVMRSMRRDDSVTSQRVTKGTARRMIQFARPYRTILIWFLVLVVIDAVIGVVNPLLFRSIIDTGIPDHNKSLIIGLALLAAVLALVDAGLSIGIRWVSAKVGEGLIFDMRSKVFEHIQKMPIAFFTRTQTGALISRLNNDVIGAQQAFTDTLSSVVSNLISVTLVLIVMFALSWQITLISLVILPLFVLPAKRVGRRLSVDHPRVVRAERPDEQHHDRALQRLGRPAGQAVRPTGPGARRVRAEGRPGARHRGHPGHVRPVLHRRPDAHRGAGHRRRLRLGRHPGGRTARCSWGRWWPWPPT